MAGWTVAGAGDVNGDGYQEVLVGAYGVDANSFSAGAAYLISHDGVKMATVLGMNEDDRLGWAVTGASDLDRDGYADVLIGAPGLDDGAAEAGGAYLFYGPLSGTKQATDADAALIADLRGGEAGYSLEVGNSSILIGAPGAAAFFLLQ